MNAYDQGTKVRVSVVFTNVSGVATDPGAVTCGFLKPDGTTLETTPATQDSTGHYHADIDTTTGPGGVWLYRFSGTDPLQVVGDSAFYVKPISF